MSPLERIEHFLAVSWLYFQMTEKNATSVSVAELEDLISAINGDDESSHHADPWDTSIERH